MLSISFGVTVSSDNNRLSLASVRRHSPKRRVHFLYTSQELGPNVVVGFAIKHGVLDSLVNSRGAAPAARVGSIPDIAGHHPRLAFLQLVHAKPEFRL